MSGRAARRCATREDEAAVEQQRCGRGEERRLRLAEAGEGAAERSHDEPGEDERVAERASPNPYHGDDDRGERAERVRRDCEDAGREEGKMRLSLGDRAAADGSRERHGNGDTDREPDIDERQWPDTADAGELERPRAEQGRCEQAAEEVVDAERRVAPVGCRAPCDRAGAGGEGTERGGPGQEARCRALPVPAHEVCAEAQRDEGGKEGEERFHQRRA